jgi:hypothetical protein
MVMHVGLVLECRTKYLDKKFKIVNLYGPFSDKKVFQEMFKEKGSMEGDNIIVDGDLNLKLNLREI